MQRKTADRPRREETRPAAARAGTTPQTSAALVMQRVIGNQALLRRRGAGAPRVASLPGGLRSQLEARGGVSLADVRVHHDSPQPRRHEALAFTRGPEIHLAPGQEQHLPHEAWHAVQQRQGRVPATGTVAGAALNDDAALEREADGVGVGAPRGEPRVARPPVLQRIRVLPNADGEWLSDLNPGAVVEPGEGWIRVTSFTSAAASWGGALTQRDHAYVGIEYVDEDRTPHTVFTDLTHDGVRLSDGSMVYTGGVEAEDVDGKTVRNDIENRLNRSTLGTSYKVTEDQAVAAIERAREILGQYLGKDPPADSNPKYRFNKSGTALTEHGINCARFAQKVLKAAGIEISAGAVAKTPFEVANQKDDSQALKLIDATEPAQLDVAATTRDLKQMPSKSGRADRGLAAIRARRNRQRLAPDDLDAIVDWVAGGWGALNKFARGMLTDEEIVQIDSMMKNRKPMPSLETRIGSLNAALDKMHSFEGTTYRVARAASDDVYGKLIQPGDYIGDHGYTASSMVRGGEGGASGWGAEGLVHFEIKGHSGRDISQFSPMKGEREVLFKRDTTFKVEAIKVEANGRVFVIVREVEAVARKPIKNSYDGSILRPAFDDT